MSQSNNRTYTAEYSRSSRRFASWLMALLALGSLATISGCGGSTSSPPKAACKQAASATIQFTNTSEGSIIVPGIIAVSVTGGGVTSTSTPADILTEVNSLLAYCKDPRGTFTVEAYSSAGETNSWLTFAPPSGVSGDFTPSSVAFFQLQIAGADDTTDADLKTAIDTINYIVSIQSSGADNAYINGASPDWLMLGSAANNAIGAAGGYIGGSPSEPPIPDHLAMPNTGLRVPKGGDCQQTSLPTNDYPTVYVLDTGDDSMPSGETAPVAGCLCPPGVTCSRLVGALGGGVPVLEQYDPLPDLTAYTTAFGKVMWFQSHGLAVAAVIHHLAPQVPIVMRTVLNQYGVGDFQTLLSVLQSIWLNTNALGSGTIINMSLTIEPPPECILGIWNDGYGPMYASNYKIDPGMCHSGADLHPSEGNGYQLRLLQPIFETIGKMADQGYQIVAAAGNDSDTITEGGTVYAAPADFPAALCGTIAVAATKLPTDGDRWKSGGALTTFSNEPFFYIISPDRRTCIASQSEATQPMMPAYALGMNICTLDTDPTVNDPPQAGEWSGTSFATALVSGNLAFNEYQTGAGGYGSLATLNETGIYQPCTPST